MLMLTVPSCHGIPSRVSVHSTVKLASQLRLGKAPLWAGVDGAGWGQWPMYTQADGVRGDGMLRAGLDTHCHTVWQACSSLSLWRIRIAGLIKRRKILPVGYGIVGGWLSADVCRRRHVSYSPSLANHTACHSLYPARFEFKGRTSLRTEQQGARSQGTRFVNTVTT